MARKDMDNGRVDLADKKIHAAQQTIARSTSIAFWEN